MQCLVWRQWSATVSLRGASQWRPRRLPRGGGRGVGHAAVAGRGGAPAGAPSRWHADAAHHTRCRRVLRRAWLGVRRGRAPPHDAGRHEVDRCRRGHVLRRKAERSHLSSEDGTAGGGHACGTGGEGYGSRVG